MLNVARLPEGDRHDLFMDTAQSMGVHQAIIEKDFWVCWILDYLFHNSPWRDNLVFKGGTSLSKAFVAIERFSEDVDLIVDWSVLGYTEEDAFQDRTAKQRKIFEKELKLKKLQFLRAELVPVLQEDLTRRLDGDIAVSQGEELVLIEYPRSFEVTGLQPRVILEIGPKGLKVPNEQAAIRPYAAEKNPGVFKVSRLTNVLTVSAERTFWEKATILHQEAHRGPEKKLPLRYSRHYYDLYRLSKTEILGKALDKMDLLENVVQFKMRFFYSKWARYEDAKPGTLKLLPTEHHVDGLKKDYASMQSMLFGDGIPSFEDILTGLEELQERINNGADD